VFYCVNKINAHYKEIILHADKYRTMPLVRIENRYELCFGNRLTRDSCGYGDDAVCNGCEDYLERIRDRCNESVTSDAVTVEQGAKNKS